MEHSWSWSLILPPNTSADTQITIKDVLTLLDADLSVIAWKTGHAGVKGCTKYLLALEGDRFQLNPDPNNRGMILSVKVRPEDVRLYYFMKPFNKGK
jgi:hypothetical protein